MYFYPLTKPLNNHIIFWYEVHDAKLCEFYFKNKKF